MSYSLQETGGHSPNWAWALPGNRFTYVQLEKSSGRKRVQLEYSSGAAQ